MKTLIKKIEDIQEKKSLKEIELMITIEEMKIFADYCLRHEIKFNDWIRSLAHDALAKEHDAGVS